MPKKTRQAKVIAQLKRLQTMQGNPTNTEQTVKTGTINLKDIPVTNPIQPKPQTIDYRYVLSDLKKTAIFAVVAIVFEVVLSLTASIWYANLISRLF